jgi:hypothetical protein
MPSLHSTPGREELSMTFKMEVVSSLNRTLHQPQKKRMQSMLHILFGNYQEFEADNQILNITKQ